MEEWTELRCRSPEAVKAAFAAGYSTVVLDHRIDASALEGGATVAADLAAAAAGSYDVPAGAARLRLLSRLTVVLAAPRLDLPVAVLRAFDVLAIEPTTEAAFAFACGRCDAADVISVDCARKCAFAIARGPVAAATRRGACFEVCYASAILEPTSMHHLVGTAAHLRALCGRRRGGIVLSSGAGAAAAVRAPLDVVRIATAVLGFRRGDAVAALTLQPGAVCRHAAGRAVDVGAARHWLDSEQVALYKAAHAAAAARSAAGGRSSSSKKKKRRLCSGTDVPAAADGPGGAKRPRVVEAPAGRGLEQGA
ncbi:RNase P subunit p30-domain-containing protein [Pelagophyceae sp. CCMP2097]|nr:RNase P subunit p30-domain-containing protein [Pelagophyceae sp. CCMP2097]